MYASKVIDLILAEHLVPLMKTRGFRRKGQRFWRVTGRFVELVELQKSAFNSKREVAFTINLGVYFHPVGGPGGVRVAIMPPKNYECTIEERIGTLFGKGLDSWWEVRGIRQAPRLGEDLCEKVLRFGLPWLESMHDLRAMLRYDREHPGLFAKREVRKYLKKIRESSNASKTRRRRSRNKAPVLPKC